MRECGPYRLSRLTDKIRSGTGHQHEVSISVDEPGDRWHSNAFLTNDSLGTLEVSSIGDHPVSKRCIYGG